MRFDNIVKDNNRTATILLVEDNDEFSEVLSNILIDNHYNVLKARDGERALSLIKEQRPEVILLDIMLAPSQGKEWIGGREILNKMIQEGFQSKIIVMSEIYKDMTSILEFIKLGAADYVAKPVYPGDILERVKNVIADDAATNLQVIHRAPLIDSYLERSNDILDKHHDVYAKNLFLDFMAKTGHVALAVIVIILFNKYTSISNPFILFMVFFILLIPVNKISRFMTSVLGGKAEFEFKEGSFKKKKNA